VSDSPIEIDYPAPDLRHIALDRPEQRNALSDGLRGQLIEALSGTDRDADV